MVIAQKRGVKNKQRRAGDNGETTEDVQQNVIQNVFSGTNIGGKVKFGAHCALVVAERIIGRLVDGYRQVFIIDEKASAEFHKDHGLASFDAGDYEKAAEYLSTSIKNESKDDAEVLYYLGMSYSNLEDNEKALECLNKADKIENNDSDIISEIGACLIKLEKYVQATGYLKRAIELSPDEVNSYYLLGTAYEKTEKFPEAIEVYKKAIDLAPKDPLYYHALGFVFETSGNHRSAISCFKKAMELEKHR